MSQIDQEILEDFLNARQPSNMLLIGLQARLLVERWCRNNPQCDVKSFDTGAQFNATEFSSQFEFSVLAGALNETPRPQLEQLIASLRDRHSRQLVVQLDPPQARHDTAQAHPSRDASDAARLDETLRAEDLRALGLLRLAGSDRTFQFNLHDYKAQPDWLNARFWANPQRWNKDRW